VTNFPEVINMNEQGIKAIVDMLGARIAGLRAIKNWSQQELAERAGISRGFLSEIETGKSMPSFEILLKVAAAFDVHLGYFTETGDKIRLDHIAGILPEELRELIVSDKFIPYLRLVRQAEEWSLNPETLSELMNIVRTANKRS
jgi:transcriptional regulator with XRE-family HTH domain